MITPVVDARRYGLNRRDDYLLRTETGWQVVGRQGGDENKEVAHYFDQEDDARVMLSRMLQTVPRSCPTGRRCRDQTALSQHGLPLTFDWAGLRLSGCVQQPSQIRSPFAASAAIPGSLMLLSVWPEVLSVTRV
jgi:hypothetical protein